MSSLENRLQAALDSRKTRGILRRIPDPTPPPKSANQQDQVDFYTSDYLSLSIHPAHRTRFLERIRERYSNPLPNDTSLTGSGGSRLLVNSTHHNLLERRLTSFFNAPHQDGGILFNSGFDANVGLFSTLPGPEDFVIYDEYIHASIHDGIRASRTNPSRRRLFKHNDLNDLETILKSIAKDIKGDSTAGRKGNGEGRNIFIAVEALYSMDGDYTPLTSILSLMDIYFPTSLSKTISQAHLIVDEAHSTCICGPQGRGLVVHLGLEQRVLARLHTFGKAMAASGSILLTSPLIKHYLVNYARTLIYTTAINHPTLTAIETSLDMLENGVAPQLSSHLTSLTQTFLTLLKARLVSAYSYEPPTGASDNFDTTITLRASKIPSRILTLPSFLLSPHTSSGLPPPSPIIPLLTPHPHSLSRFLSTQHSLIARPITYPTVPKGADRVRVCLHAGNSIEEVERLARGIEEWAEGILKEESGKRRVSSREALLDNCHGGGMYTERVLATKL